jgi:uncharacterized membrane protein
MSEPAGEARQGLTYPPEVPDTLGSALERNIRALDGRRREQMRRADWQEKLARQITRFTGSMPFVYLHLVVFGLWVLVNAGLIPNFRPWDPSFVMLATEASVEAIFLSTFVLISQNRAAAVADQRADLDLQINLLAEHEITRTLQLVTEIARKLDIAAADEPELDELKRDVAPEAVLDKLDRSGPDEA